MVVLGDTVPDFDADSTLGRVRLHEYLDGSWGLLFSHPSDFTPVCTSEIGAAAKLQGEFARRGVKLIGLACNDVESHCQWIKDIEGSMSEGAKIEFPIIADVDRSICEKYGMFDSEEKDEQGKGFAARAVYVIGPDRRLRLSIL